MTITVNAIPFDLSTIEKDSVTLRDFTGEAIDDSTLSFKRVAPKPTKDFVGMEKGEAKLTVRDAQGKVSAIYILSTSIRADQTEASKLAGLTTLVAVGGHAATQNLVKEQRLPLAGV